MYGLGKALGFSLRSHTIDLVRMLVLDLLRLLGHSSSFAFLTFHLFEYKCN